MAKTYTFTWTLDTWANRASATYVPVDVAIDGKHVDRNGQVSGTAGSMMGNGFLQPYYVEDTENGVIYKTYQSGTGIVPIIKITEA